jgi:hypothetical protein
MSEIQGNQVPDSRANDRPCRSFVNVLTVPLFNEICWLLNIERPTDKRDTFDSFDRGEIETVAKSCRPQWKL